ncbi:MAG: diguanylate cyclase [Phormidesmis sp.]
MLNRLIKLPFLPGHSPFHRCSGSLLNAAETTFSGSGLARKALVPAIHPTVGCRQPINEADKQPLVKLSDPQGTTSLSARVSCSVNPINTASSESADDRQTHCRVPNPDVSPVDQSVSALDEDVFQMQQHICLQRRLRQAERQLRNSLDPEAIYGATVVETAHLFKARQVSLLQYGAASQCWRQMAQYCQDRTLAWQPPLTVTPIQFPSLIKQLYQGRPLQIFAGQLIAAAEPEPDTLPPNEIRQWLDAWPGNWLLVPVRNSRLTTYFLNGSPVTAGSRLLSENLETAARAEALSDEKTLAERSDDINKHWGVIALALPEQKSWVDGAIAAAQSIALELALALEQARQYQELITANQELQKLALSDSLTSLANRRRFDEHLADEWQRLARDQQPLSLILCDLDHFKRYNDAFGHPAGDHCLIRIARALLNGPQRPADLVARYGGEEFAIILPNTDTHGAWRIARKIHGNIRDLEIAHAPHSEEPYVTVTMGISTVVPSHDSTAQLLVQAADLALYHAKQHGRNRTYVHAIYNTVDSAALNAGDGSQPQVILSTESSTLS